jgi:hypothetical protein
VHRRQGAVDAGPVLRGFSFGHVRQLDAVASRLLIGLTRRAPLLPGADRLAYVDVDDTVRQTSGLNALLGTVTTPGWAPVIVATRLCADAPHRTAAPSGEVTDPRARNCVGSMRSCGGPSLPAIRAVRISAACRPSSWAGCATTLIGGVTTLAQSASSNAMRDICSGTVSSASRSARRTPSATGLLEANTAVGGVRAAKASATVAQGGGMLYDLGPHLIDQAIQLFGPLRTVHAELANHPGGSGADDDAFVSLLHASSVRSQLWMTGLAAQAGPRFHVLGSSSAYTK